MPRDNSLTDRRGYQRPPIGDDWAGAWDDLVEDQDELSIERGAIADRPSTGAYDDAMYYAVDQRTLWRWDAAASDWEAAGGLGTASDPVPGTTHLESLSTANLTVANGLVAGELIGSDSGQKSALNVPLTDWTSYRQVVIDCEELRTVDPSTTADIELIFDSDESTAYDYFDIGEGGRAGATAFRLAEVSGLTRFSGPIVITRNAENQRAAITPLISDTLDASRVNALTIRGDYRFSIDSSITIRGLDSSATQKMSVYGVGN